VNIALPRCICLLVTASCLTLAAYASPALDGVVLYALFRDQAILTIDGARHVLKAGESSPEGVKLISTDTELEQAVIEAGGRRETLKLGVVMSRHDNSAPAAVTLWADSSGMFFASGSINGTAVSFLVDTGANTVALSGALAQRLGIDYKKKGKQGMATTASGRVMNYMLKLDTVKIGEIVLHNVDAAVLEGYPMSTPLLGMSVLNNLEMRRDGNKMELIKKY
jgi:aspartyl protease family protein